MFTLVMCQGCVAREYLLKLLRDQGLPRRQLNTVFDAPVYADYAIYADYALPVWSGFMSVELNGQVNSFLMRAFKCGFCSKLYTIKATADDADMNFFVNMANPRCCVHSLLPLAVKSCNHYLRAMMYALTRCDCEMHNKLFVTCCLFKLM